VKKSLAIRPVAFYRNGLPRPRFFDNHRFNSYRVDTPLSVLDPLLSWAQLEKSSPAAPIVLKRRRYLDDEEIGSEDVGVVRIRRKLSDDFDRVAEESKTELVEANEKKKIEQDKFNEVISKIVHI